MAIVLSFFCKLWDCDNTSFDIIFQKERKKKFFYFIIPSVRQFLKGIGDEIFERREIEESENFKKIVKHCIREQGPTEQFFLCQKKKKTSTRVENHPSFEKIQNFLFREIFT